MKFATKKKFIDYFKTTQRSLGRYIEQGKIPADITTHDFTDVEIVKIKKFIKRHQSDRRTRNFPHVDNAIIKKSTHKEKIEEDAEEDSEPVPITTDYTEEWSVRKRKEYASLDIEDIEKHIKIMALLTAESKFLILQNKFVDINACVDVIYRQTEQMFSAVKDKIRGIPANIALQLEGQEVSEIQRILLRRIDECLEDLVSYEPSAIRKTCKQTNKKSESLEASTDIDD